jgi:hypothetical protein
MDKNLGIIDAYNQLLYDIYDRENLVCLSDNGYTINGRNVLAVSNPAVVRAVKAGLYTNINQALNDLKLPEFNEMDSENEIIVATADLKYRLGTMYTYYPYAVVLRNSFYYMESEKRFYYEQTRNDARYNREIPVAFESLYKYWQRLADYLLKFFPEGLIGCGGKSFFHTPFQYIKKNHPHICQSKNYEWLNNFADHEYPKFNKRRRFFVHTAGYDNGFFQDFLKANNSEAAVSALDAERADLLGFLKYNLDLCIDGYFKMMDFLDELDFRFDVDTNKFTYSLRVECDTTED